MKKQIVSLFLTAIVLLFVPLPAFAAAVDESLPRVVDNANLLTDTEASELASQIRAISERQQFDIVIVTVESLDGTTPRAFADDFYDYNNYGYGSGHDGLLLLLNMGERDWYLSTCGFGIQAITDAGREFIIGCILEDLQSARYYRAFSDFAAQIESFVSAARSGDAYDSQNLPHVPAQFDWGRKGLLALVLGFLLALIATGVMRSKMKSVRPQPTAANYTRPNSLYVREARDFFLYAKVTRTPRPKDNGSGGSRTHSGSSGVSHGGGGGKF